jgi:hypothetical protein
MTWLLNPKVWIAIAVAAALAFSHFFMYRAGRASLRGEFDAYKIAQQEARILADRAQRTEEQRRAAAIAQEAANAQTRISALEDDVRHAGAAADGLRAAAAGAASRSRASACSATASAAQPGGDPLGLLVDVLGRADKRAGELAEYADRLRVAGIACERSYDALTIK